MLRKLLGLTCVTTVFAGLGAGAATAAPADWTVTPVPELPSTYRLNAVATTNTDAFAVGHTGANGWAGTVALHWDGKGWQHKPTPKGLALLGAKAFSPTDVWAVGIAAENKTLISHWDGQRWQAVSSPAPGNPPSTASTALTDVDGPAPDDVWAVGCAETDDLADGVGMLQHWDGKAWTAVELPKPDGATYVCPRGITVRGTDDIWAAGHIGTAQGARPFTMHFDGTAWKSVPAAQVDGGRAKLTDITVSGGNVWASGLVEGNGDPYQLRPLIQRWDGTKWAVSPNPLQDKPGLLYAATADATGNVWVGGYTIHNDPIVLRWDGTSWSEHTKGLPDKGAIMGLAVDRDEGKTVWAAGDTGDPATAMIARASG